MGILSKMSKEKTFQDTIATLVDQPEPDWFSTGSYALNGILSGNVHKGISSDTVTALVGPSNSGKSLILAHLVKDALEQGYEILLFDSERAVRQNYYKLIGCDPEKIFRVPVGSTLQFRNKAFQYIEEFYSRASKGEKLFVGLDSLGNLASDKELADTEKDKTASDQGSNAKFQNSGFRVISSLASEYNFPFVLTNHTYAPIGDLFAQRDKISGGSKGIYNAQVILYLERLVNKEEVEDVLGKKSKTHVGIRIKATTIKNRVYPEEKSAYINLRYDSGINPYSGLLEPAIRAGILENKPRGYLVKATGKTVFDKNLYTPEIFTPEALDQINNWYSQNGYSSLSDIFSNDVAQSLGEDNGKEKDSEEE